MPSIQELEQALIEADKAGDTESASVLAADIERLMSAPKQPERPGLLDIISGKHTVGEFASGRVEALKEGAKEFANIPEEISNFPPITEETKDQMREAAQGIALSTMPVSKIAGSAKSALFPKTGAEVIKDQTLKNAGKAGYYVPRANIKQNLLTNLGERFGGKAGIEATARIQNQPITNKLANKALGLTDDIPITKEVLDGIREHAGKAYEAVSNIGTLTADKAYMDALRIIKKEFSGASKDFPELASKDVTKLVNALSKKEISSSGAVEMVKNLRRAANANWHSPNPSDRLLAKAQGEAANVLDDLIERNIEPALGKEMMESYRAARILIAKTHTVERALNPSTGNIVATEIAKQGKKIKLDNELKEIAEFARAFPKAAGEPLSGPAAGGLLESMAFGAGAKHIQGSPTAAVVGASVPIIGKPIARRLTITRPRAFEKDLTTPFLVQRALLANHEQ